jgi:hypothetical protein
MIVSRSESSSWKTEASLLQCLDNSRPGTTLHFISRTAVTPSAVATFEEA